MMLHWGGVGLCLILIVSAIIEYLFPPYPGDLIQLLGAFLSGLGFINPIWVLLSMIIGGIAGGLISYRIAGPITAFLLKKQRWVRRIEILKALFKKFGLTIFIVNRFFPGLRALFFPMAHLMGIPIRRLIFHLIMSNILWSLFLLSIGLGTGSRWGEVKGSFQIYFHWVGLALSLFFLVAFFLSYLALRRQDNRKRYQNDREA